MKLDITSIIKDNGGSIGISKVESLKDLESDLGMVTFTSPVSFTGTVMNNNGMLVLSGNAKVNYSTVCDRCGEKIERELSIPVNEDIIERSKAEDEAEECLEDDRFTFSGNVLELDRILADCLITNIPMTHVCREDCPGLCPLCGSAIKGESCDCNRTEPKDTVNSRFEALKGFFD